MAAEEYSRRLARVAVAQMAEMAGFTKAQQSAVDILSELLLKYVGELCSTAHSYAELANRTEFNVCDLSTALADMGSSFGDLKAYLDIYLAEQGTGSHDQAFPHPLPEEYPVRCPGRSLPSWEERAEEPPQHVPRWMPAFPDAHTWRHTPLHQGHEQDPVKQQEARAEAKAQLQRAREALSGPTPTLNPHLTAPEVQLLLQPANTALQGAARPTAAAGGAAGAAAGGGEGMALDEGPSQLGGSIVWSAVDVAAAAGSGTAVLNLPAGFSLDLGSRTRQQAQAMAGRKRTQADAFSLHGSTPVVDLSSGKRGGARMDPRAFVEQRKNAVVNPQAEGADDE